MALKAKWLKQRFSGKARFVYTVHGTTAELAEYVENQGDNARFLQDDGTIGLEETATPVLYSTVIIGKNPTLAWNAEYERYQANVTFEDSVLMDAAARSFATQPADTQSDEGEGEGEQPANLEQPAANPQQQGRGGSRRKIGGK